MPFCVHMFVCKMNSYVHVCFYQMLLFHRCCLWTCMFLSNALWTSFPLKRCTIKTLLTSLLMFAFTQNAKRELDEVKTCTRTYKALTSSYTCKMANLQLDTQYNVKLSIVSEYGPGANQTITFRTVCGGKAFH